VENRVVVEQKGGSDIGECGSTEAQECRAEQNIKLHNLLTFFSSGLFRSRKAESRIGNMVKRNKIAVESTL
jgi:hypothetical protein